MENLGVERESDIKIAETVIRTKQEMINNENTVAGKDNVAISDMQVYGRRHCHYRTLQCFNKCIFGIFLPYNYFC